MMKCVNSQPKSSFMNVPTGHFGSAKTELGAVVTILPLAPGTNSPMIVNAAIEMISAPGMRSATSIGVTSRPASVSSTGGRRASPCATYVVRVGNDEARAAQPDEDDQRAHARLDADLQSLRHVLRDPLAQLGKTEREEYELR